ncbi:PAS domain-containing protein [Methylobacterium nigriterrae]|uniref:PAS domain-containing protein n=1 Tax=Methylobacterium nigriterrae TaxID=3127512 RepID=UPI0030134F5A
MEQTVAELTASRAALAASEARYCLAVESASDYAIFTTDLSGRITGWNSGAQNLMGWSEGRLSQQAPAPTVPALYFMQPGPTAMGCA